MHTERMAEIARRWRNMSESEQKAYTTKRDLLHRQHAKALEQFKKVSVKVTQLGGYIYIYIIVLLHTCIVSFRKWHVC